MIQQISFIHEGKRYFTFVGCNYIAGNFPDTNAVEQNVLLSNQGYQSDLKLSAGVIWNKIPIVEDAEVTKDGDFFNVTGQVLIDGNKVPVNLTREGLMVELPVEVEPSIPEPAKDAGIEEPVEEPEIEEEPAIEPEVETEAEPEVATEQDTEEVEQEEPVNSDTTEEQVVEEIPAAESEEKSIVDRSAEVVNTLLDVVNSDASTADKAAMINSILEKNRAGHNIETDHVQEIPAASTVPTKPVYKRRSGLTFGKRDARNKIDLTIGREDKPVQGIVFSATVLRHPKGTQRNPSDRVVKKVGGQQKVVPPNYGKGSQISYSDEQTLLQAQRIIEEMQAQKKREEESKRDEEASWAQAVPIGERINDMHESIPKPDALTPAYEAVEPIKPFEEVKQPEIPRYEDIKPTEVSEELSPEEARQARKEQVRSTLTPEVNAVIGDIPIELLGNIAEYTADPVPVDKLDDMYCIDRRWLKQGRWYCIDVVCNKSRYFYNSKKGVSLEIPINACKAWAEALA